MSKNVLGAVTPSKSRSLPEILFGWAKWHNQNGLVPATRIVVFRKGDIRLVVHEYGSKCGILKLGEVAPRVRGFRIWSQPFYTVAAKLQGYGWQEDDHKKAVQHAA